MAAGAPPIVAYLARLLIQGIGSITEDLDCAEYFAGEQAVPCRNRPGRRPPHTKVTGSWIQHGFKACPFEILLLPSMDILSAEGTLGQGVRRNGLSEVLSGPPHGAVNTAWSLRNDRHCLQHLGLRLSRHELWT